MNTPDQTHPQVRNNPTRLFTHNKFRIPFVAGMLLLAVSARAATVTWSGGDGSGYDLSQSTNWVGGAVPSVVTPDIAQWDGSVAGVLSLTNLGAAYAGAAGNVGIDLNITAGQTSALKIDSNTNTVALRMSNLTIANGAGPVTLGDGVGTFNFTLGGAGGTTQTWTSDSASAATVNSDVVLGLGGGGTHTFALAGAGNWTLNNIIGGAINVTKTGAGTATLTGANTFSGITTVTLGTLTLNGSLATGAGAVAVNPASGTTATLNILGPVTRTGAFNVGTVAGGTGIVNVNANLTLNGGSSAIIIGNAGYGVYNQTAGTVISGQYLVAGITGAGAIGVMNISGGSYSPKAGNNGGTVGATANTTGQLNMTGTGSYVSTDTTANGAAGIYIGEAGVGTLNISGSATMTLGGTTNSQGLDIGRTSAATCSGVVNLGAVGLGGGTITANIVRHSGAAAGGALNFHGGTLKAATFATNNFMSGLPAASVYAEGAVIDDSGMTLNISQPLLAPAGNGVNTIASFTGGSGYTTAPYVAITRGAGDNTGLYATAIAQVNLDSTSGTFGQVTNVVITNPGINYTVPPIFTLTGGTPTSATTITGAAPTANTSGGLTKLGAGTITLLGANSYTGATVVKAGRLVLNAGQPNTSAITVSNSATLRVVAVGSSHVSPSTLAVGNATGGATLEFGVNSTTQAPLTPGTLVLNNANTINIVAGNFVAGNSYPLVTYTTLSGAGSYALGTLPGGVTGNITTVGNTIQLNVTTVTNTVWTGLVSGTWDINTTANWTNLGTAGNKYLDGSVVQFDDTGINTTTVTNLALIMTPGAITVNNTAKNYAIKNVVAGAGGITKTGTGNLTNTAANTYSGPTIINQGKVAAGVASVANVNGALGLNSAVSLANDVSAVLDITGFATQIGSLTGGGTTGGNVILGAATLTVGGDHSSPAAYGGVISGTGGLTKIGAGTLTLNNTNTYTGVTTVSAGKLALTGSATISSITAGFVVGNVNGANAAVYQSGSTAVTAQPTGGGWQLGSAAGASGYYNLSSGTMMVTNGGEFDPGGSAGGAGTFGQFDMSGGSLIVGLTNSTTASYFLPNRGGVGEASVVNISGGTVSINSNMLENAAFAGFEINWAAGGQTNTTTISGNAVFTSPSVSVKLNQANNAANVCSLNLNGGLFQTLGFTAARGASAVVNFNGGTLKAGSSANANFMGNIASVYLYGNGGTIDNNGLALSIGQALSSPSANGVASIAVGTAGSGYIVPPQVTIVGDGTGATAYATIDATSGAVTGIVVTCPGTGYSTTPTVALAGGGGFGASSGAVTMAANTSGPMTFTGAGTTTLTGAYSITNGIKVLGGTLALSTGNGLPSPAGSLIVSNAALTIDASSGNPMPANNVSIGSTLSLVLNPNTVGLNAAGNVTLGTNSTLNLSYGAVNPNPTAAAINLAGSLVKGTNIVINISAGGLSVGSFPLITAGSAVTTNNFKLGTLPPGIVAVLTNSTANSLDLVITGAGQLLNWHGANVDNTIVMTNWNINANANWYDLSFALTKYLQYSGNSYGDNVTFGDNGYNTDGTNNVSLTNTVVPATVTFSSGSPYRLTGAGAIGGAASLLLTNGAAAFYLETSNTYTGGTVVGSGTLVITNNSALGNAAGPVSIVGGALQLNNNVASTRALSVNANSSIGVVAGATASWSGVLSGTGTLTKTDNGTLTFGVNNTFAGSTVVSAGTLNYSGIVTNTLVTVGNVASVNAKLGIAGNVVASSLLVGNNGGVAASVTQTAGNSVITGGGGDCMSVGNIAGAYGYYNAVGGTLTVNGIAVGGENNTGTGFSGTGGDGIMEINGGTINNVGWLVMARGATAETGILNVFSGSLAFAGGGLQPNWGAGQTSIINIMGGSISSTNVPVNFRNAGNIGILNLNGGVLQPTAVTGAGVLNLNGGTLSPATSFATPFLNLSSNVYVYSGGAKIDDNGLTLTISQPLLAPTGYGASSIAVGSGGSGYIAPPIVTISGGSGANATAIATVSGGVVTGITVTSPGNGYLAGDAAAMAVNFSGGGGTGASATVNTLTLNVSGGLVKRGAGTLTLSGTNTYTGTTVVTNGSLLLTPAHQAGSPVVVADNAKFGMNASSVSNSATIGALTLGSSGATTLAFTYGFAGNPTNVALTAGAVVINGTSTIQIGGSFALGAFPVLKYTSLSGAFNTTVSAPRGMGASVSNDTVNKVIYVVVTSLSSPIVWTGTNSIVGKTNLWDLNTTTNWLIAGSPTTYQETLPPGDAVLFNDIGTGLVLLSNTASPVSVTISNNSVAYTFQGTGQINSTAGLTKLGSGTVTLNLPGTYSVSTLVSNGTISLGTNQTFANLSGSGTVTTASGAPTITATSTTNTTFGGSLQGALNLTKTGSGTLTLSGTNTFSGNLFAKSGSVIIDSGAVNNSGTLWTSIGQDGTDNATLTLKGTGVFTNNFDFNVGDVGSAVGTLNIQDNAVVNVLNLFVASANAAASTATGTININGGTLIERNGAAGFFVLGTRNSANAGNGLGIINLTNGVIKAACGVRVGDYGTGIVNQYGGLFEVTNNSTGINLRRETTGVSGTYNLNGGTLRTEKVTSSQTTGDRLFYFNGGILQAANGNLGATPFMNNLSHAYIRNGGAIIDNNGYSIIIDQLLEHSDIGGDNATDGGLTKNGNGTLTMNVVNTFTGPTTINGGTLAGTGTFPSVLTNNATLSPGDGGIGSLTVNGNLTLNGLSTNVFEVNGTTPANDSVVAGAAVKYGGVLTVVPSGTFTVGQQFLLFTGTGATNASNFASVQGSPGGGLGFTFTNGVLSVVTAGPSGSNQLTNSVTGGGTTLSLSWGAGWKLQMQTNSLSTGLSTNWSYITDGTLTSTNITIDATKPTVFYRLVYP